MGCGCEATITDGDTRAEIWQYVFGKKSFPLIHPLPSRNPNFPGKLFFQGDATELTKEQRERLIEKMTQKFSVSREHIEQTLKEGIVPILDDHIIVSWCPKHYRAAI